MPSCNAVTLFGAITVAKKMELSLQVTRDWQRCWHKQDNEHYRQLICFTLTVALNI